MKDPKRKGKDKGTAEPKDKGPGTVDEGFVLMNKDVLVMLYQKAKDLRLPDGGLADGGVLI